MEVSGKKKFENDLSGSLHHVSDDADQLYCLPCDHDGSQVPAYGYCQDCAEHLCKSCYKYHLKPAPLRNHVLLDSSKMPQTQHLSLFQTLSGLTETCQIHSGKVLEYFCQDHNMLGCSPCITINHRTCMVDYIPDASKDFDSSLEYKRLEYMIKALHNSCTKMAQSAKDNKKKIRENQNAIKEEIRKFRREINCILDNWETKAVQKVDQLLRGEIVRIDSIDTECSKTSTELGSLQNELDKLDQSKSLNKLFIIAKRKKDKIKDYKTSLSQMQEHNYIKIPKFKQNLAIERILKTEKCLGDLTFERDESIGPANVEGMPSLQNKQYKHLVESTGLQQQVNIQKNLTYDKTKATFSENINIRVRDDTNNCWIRGLAVISRDQLAATDYENCSVKLVDTVKKEVVTSLKMSARPLDIAALPDDELAVTLPGQQIIQVLSSLNGLSIIWQVQVDGECSGLAYSEGQLFVGFKTPAKVQIMTLEGKVLRTIQCDKAGDKIFTCPWYVTVDEKNKTIYVSDTFGGTGITCLNWLGEVTGVYKDSKLDSPRGLLVLADGSLLACGDFTIHLVSPDLGKSRTITKPLDESLYLGCVAGQHDKLYVGCDYQDKLLVYKMNTAE